MDPGKHRFTRWNWSGLGIATQQQRSSTEGYVPSVTHPTLGGSELHHSPDLEGALSSPAWSNQRIPRIDWNGICLLVFVFLDGVCSECFDECLAGISVHDGDVSWSTQAIPSDLYDAADLDGANGVQKFAHVTWPLLMPALVPAIMLGIVWTFNQFNIVYLVSGGEPDNATDILISEAYRWAFARREQYGYAAAYSALIFILLLGWSVFSTRFAKRFETR